MSRLFAARVVPDKVSLALVVLLAARLPAQQSPNPRDRSLDSLLSTRVNAASKYAQSSASAPASVTILTANDIHRYGYRNLQEVLESVRGFYVSNDRNYTYLGVRGFSRPTDYNDRVLTLIDGHTLNDEVWGSARVGTEFRLNLDAVERIEIVRGPGSVLYGTNAMFAVINIVTKTGVALDGATVSARGGSGRTREGAVTVGHSLGAHASFAASGLMMRSDGNDLFFPEYNSPQTNNGIAHGLDWEDGGSAIGTLSVYDATVRAGYSSRSKGIPTGAFGSAFDDPRAQSSDRTTWFEAAMQRQFCAQYRASLRLYGDHYQYTGVYPAGPGPAYTDGASSTDAGGEALLIWDPVSRNRLTLGSELRQVLRAEYHERQTDGTVTSDDAPFHITSVFAQDEFQLTSKAALVTGLRYDRDSRDHHALTPRVAIVVTPDHATTVKLLYGEAFRAPSTAEADLMTTYYVRNPGLEPEHIQTYELEASRRVAAPLVLTASAYEYHIRNLIDQVAGGAGAVAQYLNVEHSHATGVELQADVLPTSLVSAHVWVAFERAHNDWSDQPLTNSPSQIASVSVSTRAFAGVRAAVAVRYESPRRTLSATQTPAFTRTDINLRYQPRARLSAFEASVRVTNLFNVAYSAPGGVEHPEPAISQPGRTTQFRIDWHF